MEEIRGKVLNWLDHPDPDEFHNNACYARNEDAKTG